MKELVAVLQEGDMKEVCVLPAPAPGEVRLCRDIDVVTARSYHARHRTLRQGTEQTQAAVQTIGNKPRQLYLKRLNVSFYCNNNLFKKKISNRNESL